jgi:23S rRNA (pseudouridine1915-N3)-methyltransferase
MEEKKPLTGSKLMRREGELLLATVPDGARIVALDESGKDLASMDLTRQLRDWRDEGVRDITFVIGGANGLDPSVLGEADLVLALGRATWPHMLVRGLLAEQIYRAQCIMTGHPYHRD